MLESNGQCIPKNQLLTSFSYSLITRAKVIKTKKNSSQTNNYLIKNSMINKIPILIIVMNYE